jgi:uncharacterized membrane protein YphA (DoxX/SURF4 family)
LDGVRVFDFRVGVLRHRRRGLDWNIFFGTGDDFDGDGVCRFGDVVVRVSVVLPFVEVAIGALLILGSLTRFMAALGGFTMVIFIIAIAQAWARGLNIDCGCFGGGGAVAPGETKYLQEILRDLGLVFLALYLIRYPSTKFSLDKNQNSKSSQEEVA